MHWTSLFFYVKVMLLCTEIDLYTGRPLKAGFVHTGTEICDIQDFDRVPATTLLCKKWSISHDVSTVSIFGFCVSCQIDFLTADLQKFILQNRRNVLWCTVGYSSHAAEAKRAKRSNSSLWWNIFSLKSAVWASFWIEVILFGRSLSTNSGELLLLKIQPMQTTDTLLSGGFCLSFFPSHTFVLPALAPVQKLPPSTSTKSPAACWASAGSSSLQPYQAAQATSRQSTARYTPPLPPPRQRPLHRRPRPPCLTRWLSPHRATPLNWPRATPRINTTACSSRRACLSTSAKVSGQTQRFRFVPAQTVDATNHWLTDVHFCGLLLCDWWISCMHRVTRLFVWVWQHQLSLSCLLDVVSGGVSQISLPAQIHTDTQGNCYHGNRLCDARPRLSSLALLPLHVCTLSLSCVAHPFL